MAKAIAFRAGHTGDFTGRIEYAQREDGQWFQRFQEKGMKGYRWGAWKPCCEPSSERSFEQPMTTAFRLPDPMPEIVMRAAMVIEGKSIETSYKAFCYPFTKRTFGEFWLCLADRSAICTIAQRTYNASLIEVDGKKAWISHKALVTDEEMAKVDGREYLFATIAPWATETLAKLAI